jgi:hypothetical protein
MQWTCSSHSSTSITRKWKHRGALWNYPLLCRTGPSDHRHPRVRGRKSHLEQLYKSESVLTVNSLEEQTDWRLNKSWSPNTGWLSESNSAQVEDAPASEWKAHPLVLPDREKMSGAGRILSRRSDGPLRKTAFATVTTSTLSGRSNGGDSRTAKTCRNTLKAIRWNI